MKRVPNQLLEQIASQITEHAKQLGLFDELRMKLLEGIQANKDFLRLKGEFRRELDLFCSRADLGLARAKLRERLNEQTLGRSAEKLGQIVEQQVSSRKQRCEIRQLYNQQAIQFLQESHIYTPTPSPPTVTQKEPQKISSSSSSSSERGEKCHKQLIEEGPSLVSSNLSTESSDSGLSSSAELVSPPTPIKIDAKSIPKLSSSSSSKRRHNPSKQTLETLRSSSSTIASDRLESDNRRECSRSKRHKRKLNRYNNCDSLKCSKSSPENCPTTKTTMKTTHKRSTSARWSSQSSLSLSTSSSCSSSSSLKADTSGLKLAAAGDSCYYKRSIKRSKT